MHTCQTLGIQPAFRVTLRRVHVLPLLRPHGSHYSLLLTDQIPRTHSTITGSRRNFGASTRKPSSHLAQRLDSFTTNGCCLQRSLVSWVPCTHSLRMTLSTPKECLRFMFSLTSSTSRTARQISLVETSTVS